MANYLFEPLKVKFDKFNIVLSNKAHEMFGMLSNIAFDSINVDYNVINGNSVTFDVYKEIDGKTEEFWNELYDLRTIYIPQIHDFLTITVSEKETENSTVKTITAQSEGVLCMSQTYLYDIQINTEDDISRDDYIPTVLYSMENPEASLMDRVLKKLPQYKVGFVDPSIMSIQRTFKENATTIWDFLTGTVAEQFDCVFYVDNEKMTLNAYDLKMYCNKCLKRHQPHFENDEDKVYTPSCPECGSLDVSYLGEETPIYISTQNLSNDIGFTTNANSMKNTFKLTAGDDLMTAAVRALNPNGSDYITHFSDNEYHDMPQKLVDKLNSYDENYQSKRQEYSDIMKQYFESLDKILLYRSGLMPSRERPIIEAKREVAKLTMENLSPFAMSRLTKNTSVDSINSALKQYAKVFIHSGYVKVNVLPGAKFTFHGTNTRGFSYGFWVGQLEVVNNADSNDTARTFIITIEVTDDYETFLNQKIKKNIIRYDDKDRSAYQVLKIEKFDEFKNALTKYCVNRLTSFRDAIQGCLDILVQEDQASPEADFYEGVYVPYYNKLVACEDEITRRQTGKNPDGTIAEGYEEANVDYWTEKSENLNNQKLAIWKELDLENYLGKDLYKLYCSYRREQEYSNSNFQSEGLSNEEIFERAQDFLRDATLELIKASTPQYTITTNIFNLIDEDWVYSDKFIIGSWMRVNVDGNIYRLRLKDVKINFSEPSIIHTEFSNVIVGGGFMDDIKSLLSQSQSMASSYSYLQNQADKNTKISSGVEEWINSGLLSATEGLKNNEYEEVTIDKYGIVARYKNPENGAFSSHQLRITHNILAFTTDNWQSAKCALGKQTYTTYDKDSDSRIKLNDYGLNAKFVQAGQINGSQMIGGAIYSENYSSKEQTGSMIDLNTGMFSFAGESLKYIDGTLRIKGSIEGGSMNINNRFVVNSNGDCTASNMTINGGGINIGSGTFQVTNEGKLTMKQGSINIANKFIVSEQGDVIMKSATIGRSSIDEICRKDEVVKIANGQVEAKSVKAENITGTTIRGKTFIGCRFVEETHGLVMDYRDCRGHMSLYINDSFYAKYAMGCGDELWAGRQVTSDQTIYCRGTCNVGTLYERSSRRAKENINNLTEEEADKILKLSPVRFDYKRDILKYDYQSAGFIAEDVYEIMPELVIGDLDGDPEKIGVRYTMVVPYIVKKIQMMQKEINELKGLNNNV